MLFQFFGLDIGTGTWITGLGGIAVLMLIIWLIAELLKKRPEPAYEHYLPPDEHYEEQIGTQETTPPTEPEKPIKKKFEEIQIPKPEEAYYKGIDQAVSEEKKRARQAPSIEPQIKAIEREIKALPFTKAQEKTSLILEVEELLQELEDDYILGHQILDQYQEIQAKNVTTEYRYEQKSAERKKLIAEFKARRQFTRQKALETLTHINDKLNELPPTININDIKERLKKIQPYFAA